MSLADARSALGALNARMPPMVAPVAALLLSMVSIQYGASFAKGLFPLVGAEGTTALRVSLSAVILAVAFRPWRAKLSRRSAPALLVYGASLGAMNLMFYMALRTVPLGIAVALEFTGPLAVAVASSRRLEHFAWIAAAVVGLALLLPLGHTTHAIDARGALLALAAGGCWALYIIFGQKAGAEHGAQTSSLGVGIAACLVFPIGLAHAGLALFDPAILLRAIILAVLSSALPYSLEMFSLTRMPARAFGTLMSLEPAVAAMMGFAVLHEALTPTQWIAIAAIITASIGTTLTIRGKATPLPE